ncbi:MAG: hypothetical protein K2O32_12870 [Acetatifactor sp.]|nr:hypothetical protein [Acetatifactor sp.]
MNRELEKRLAEEFEFMRRGPLSEDGIDNLYNAFGIETGDGWYQLLYDMCREIAIVFETAEKPVTIEMVQIKEKYGTLRVYYNLEGENDVARKISDITQKYEDLSETVCEECGREGTLRTDLPWIQTLCDTCYGRKQFGSKLS